MKLLLHHTLGADSGHAGNTFQLVQQGVLQELGQLHRVHILHGHRSHHNRQHGGIDFQHIRRAHHLIPGGRQGADALLDIHTDGIQIHTLLKFQHHHGIIFAGSGGYFLNMLQSGHGLLQRFGHFRLHLFRAGTGIGGHDHHIGEVHVGKQIRGHFQISNHAQDQNGDHRDENGQRLFDTEFGHRKLLLPIARHHILIVAYHAHRMEICNKL